jgi:L-threonylcarbamoyladenylate synthase
VSGKPVQSSDAAALQDCLSEGGVAVFPADTVYGLACEPSCRLASQRIYEMKGRPAAKPAAVMWFSLGAAEAELARLPPRTRGAAQALLPGPVTLLLPNHERRFPLACEPDGVALDPPAPLGLRVPAWPAPLTPLGGVTTPALQSSANLSGDPPPRKLSEVPERIRVAADLLIDGGELPGLASTVIDLSNFELGGAWSVVREGAVSGQAIASAFGAVGFRC